MGDQYAVRSFLAAYDDPINQWSASRFTFMDIEDARFFHCRSPTDPEDLSAAVDLSLSKYADDVVKMILGPKEAEVQEVFERCNDSMQAFNELLLPSGYKQNADKLIAILCLTGPGSRVQLNDIRKGIIKPPFQCALATRSLGSMITHDASAALEVQCRITAINRAYFKRGKIWTQHSLPYKLRRLFLICDIQNSALSGLEAYTLSLRQCAVLDSAIVRICRIALRGKAVKRNDANQVVSGLSNLEVLRYWRLGTVHTELTIRRVKWLQQMALHPQEHRLVFAAIFGTCRGELAAGIAPGVADNAIQPSATLWAKQAYTDILALTVLDEGASLREEVGEQKHAALW